MEYWGPWSTFLRKTGGTITGNLTITGTLGVSGAASFSTISSSGLALLNSLGVTGVTNLNTLVTSALASLNSLNVINASNLNTLSTTGLATLNSLSVTLTTILNGLTTINDRLLIIWDDPVGTSPHLRLQDATGAGVFDTVLMNYSNGLPKAGFYAVSPGKICIVPTSDQDVEMPSDVLTSNPTWKVPNLTTPLDARRMLMLHSIMFG